MKISIVGAGLAGLTLALALQKAGFRPIIYEQSPTLGEVGAGIMLTPNSSRILIHLGLKDQLFAASLQPQNNYLHNYVTDEIVSASNLGIRTYRASGVPFCTIHRADLHAMLRRSVQTIDPDCIRLDYSLARLAEDGAEIRLEFENGAVERAEIVIGSDGIRSVVREQLFESTKPIFTGNVAWRGVVDNTHDLYHMDSSDMGNWIGPGRNVVVYPIRNGRELNYVAISKREAWVEEGWNVRSSPEELVEEFPGWSERMLAMFANTSPERCYKWGLFDRDPMIKIVRGRVALMGDAAHPMLPFLAQGSAMGIEDAIVIARCLESSTDPVQSLKAYEATRLERTSWIQMQARKVQQLFHSRTEDRELEARVERSKRIYEYNAITVPVTLQG